MMKTKIFLKAILFLIFVLPGALVSQSNYLGWNVYTCMKEVKDISFYNNSVYAASTGGLFSFDYNSPLSTIKQYTTINGLLNNYLQAITVDNNGDVWSGASDGSINYFNPISNTWKGITDIQISSETFKGINGLFQYGKYMFIATDFSVIKFDAINLQFVDQPYIYLGSLIPVKPPVYKVFVINDTIWAATKYGIAYANINNYLPIQTSWSDFNHTNSPMKNDWTNTITYFNGNMYFGTDSGMYYFSQNTLNTYVPSYNGNPINGPINIMSVAGNSMYFTTYKTSNNTYRVDLPNINNAQLVFSGVNINTIKPGNNSDLLIGTVYNGVNLFRNNTNNFIIPNGPYSNLIFDIAVDNISDLWETSGPIGNWANISGIYKYNGSRWKNFIVSDYPKIGSGGAGWMFVYPSRFSNVVWVGGLGNGLLKIDGDSLQLYTEKNSILQGPGFPIVTGIDEDQNGKLWVVNPFSTTPLVDFTDSIAYPVPGGNTLHTFPMNLVVDNYNTKWTILNNTQPEGGERGVIYFNEVANSGLHMDPSVFGSGIGFNDIMKDKDGQIWLATTYGIYIIPDPSQVIQNQNSIPSWSKMNIIENGLSTPLLENVVSVKTDAINNKWIGTYSHGLLYVSSDGSTLINRITQSTSGLIDDRIIYLAPDYGTGKLYIGTQSGLCSYQTVAVQAQTDCTKITAGPNPYIIPNNNLLRISGLVEGSNVKILTISGKLVIDFPSPGGKIANWDGRDVNGNLVGSGIYIIVGYNKDGSKVCTGKVAIIKR